MVEKKTQKARKPSGGNPTVREGATPRKGAKTQSSAKQAAPILGDIDLHLFGEGKHVRIYEKLGAHVMTHDGRRGVSFAVWAPQAERVSVVGNFNGWDVNKTSRCAAWDRQACGKLFIPDLARRRALQVRDQYRRTRSSSRPILTPS